MKTIIELPNRFQGRASTKGFKFMKMQENECAALFKVYTGDAYHYEVFKKKLEKVCTDFENRIYDEDQLKVKYPNDNAFGNWAWTCIDRAEAVIKFIKLTAKITNKAIEDEYSLECLHLCQEAEGTGIEDICADGCMYFNPNTKK